MAVLGGVGVIADVLNMPAGVGWQETVSTHRPRDRCVARQRRRAGVCFCVCTTAVCAHIMYAVSAFSLNSLNLVVTQLRSDFKRRLNRRRGGPYGRPLPSGRSRRRWHAQLKQFTVNTVSSIHLLDDRCACCHVPGYFSGRAAGRYCTSYDDTIGIYE